MCISAYLTQFHVNNQSAHFYLFCNIEHNNQTYLFMWWWNLNYMHPIFSLCVFCGGFGAAMAEIDVELQEPFPVDRDGKPFRAGEDQPDSARNVGCCEKFQESVSRWMLPQDARSKYLERTNCCPPPIFIILISIAEVAHSCISMT